MTVEHTNRKQNIGFLNKLNLVSLNPLEGKKLRHVKPFKTMKYTHLKDN